MATKKTFEENLQRISEIADLLSSGQLTLDESVKLYKEACDLSQKCKTMLNEAELKIITLNKDFQQTESEDN